MVMSCGCSMAEDLAARKYLAELKRVKPKDSNAFDLVAWEPMHRNSGTSP